MAVPSLDARLHTYLCDACLEPGVYQVFLDSNLGHVATVVRRNPDDADVRRGILGRVVVHRGHFYQRAAECEQANLVYRMLAPDASPVIHPLEGSVARGELESLQPSRFFRDRVIALLRAEPNGRYQLWTDEPMLRLVGTVDTSFIERDIRFEKGPYVHLCSGVSVFHVTNAHTGRSFKLEPWPSSELPPHGSPSIETIQKLLEEDAETFDIVNEPEKKPIGFAEQVVQAFKEGEAEAQRLEQGLPTFSDRLAELHTEPGTYDIFTPKPGHPKVARVVRHADGRFEVQACLPTWVTVVSKLISPLISKNERGEETVFDWLGGSVRIVHPREAVRDQDYDNFAGRLMHLHPEPGKYEVFIPDGSTPNLVATLHRRSPRFFDVDIQVKAAFSRVIRYRVTPLVSRGPEGERCIDPWEGKQGKILAEASPRSIADFRRRVFACLPKPGTYQVSLPNSHEQGGPIPIMTIRRHLDGLGGSDLKSENPTGLSLAIRTRMSVLTTLDETGTVGLITPWEDCAVMAIDPSLPPGNTPVANVEPGSDAKVCQCPEGHLDHRSGVCSECGGEDVELVPMQGVPSMTDPELVAFIRKKRLIARTPDGRSMIDGLHPEKGLLHFIFALNEVHIFNRGDRRLSVLVRRDGVFYPAEEKPRRVEVRQTETLDQVREELRRATRALSDLWVRPEARIAGLSKIRLTLHDRSLKAHSIYRFAEQSLARLSVAHPKYLPLFQRYCRYALRRADLDNQWGDMEADLIVALVDEIPLNPPIIDFDPKS